MNVTNMQRNAGFSLIELMVVVAIIGILAAVAVPNFQNFIVKSRQSEAKANLGALYSAEATFFAEWNRYFADFRDIGLAPEGTLTYAFGFSAAGVVAPGVAATPSTYTGITAAGGAATVFRTSGNCGGALPRCTTGQMATNGGAITGAVTGTTTNPGDNFTAQARSNLDSDATLDVWQINEMKALTNTANDLQ